MKTIVVRSQMAAFRKAEPLTCNVQHARLELIADGAQPRPERLNGKEVGAEVQVGPESDAMQGRHKWGIRTIRSICGRWNVFGKPMRRNEQLLSSYSANAIQHLYKSLF